MENKDTWCVETAITPGVQCYWSMTLLEGIEETLTSRRWNIVLNSANMLEVTVRNDPCAMTKHSENFLESQENMYLRKRTGFSILIYINLHPSFVYYFFLFFRAIPVTYGSSQARGLIRVAATTTTRATSGPVYTVHPSDKKCLVNFSMSFP